MKHKLLLALFMVLNYLGFAQETYVPDDNFEAFLESQGWGNGIANDDYVTTASIENVTTLNLRWHSPQITDLTGIEDFKALTSLDVLGQNLQTIDVSRNTELTNLWLSFNDRISSVDVSTNTKLQFLDIQSRGLSELIFSAPTVITYLDIRESQLTSFDLTEHPNMNNLNASGSSALTTIEAMGVAPSAVNITNCTNLQCVAVDNVIEAVAGSGAYTNWLEDDTSIYKDRLCLTYVPDDNFEAYLETHHRDAEVPFGDPTSMGNGIANDNYVYTSAIENIAYLNVSDEGITDLTGLEGFHALKELRCFKNILGDLDLTANTNLEVIECSGAGLTSINVGGLVALTKLRVGGNSLTTIDVSSNTALTTLNCTHNNLSNLDVSSNILLQELRFTNNTLTNIDVSVNTDLKSLYCNENNLTSLDIQNNTKLTALDCAENSLTALDVSLHPDLISLSFNNTSINSIDLSNNPNLKVLECNNTGLTSLNINSNVQLIELYLNDNQLTELDLSNHLMFEYLECRNNNLQSLNVKNGNITETEIYTSGNTNLSCIQVDDALWAETEWRSDVDAHTRFSTDCEGVLTIEEEILEKVILYPNPVKNILIIQTIESLSKVEVYTVLGQKLMESYQNTIDVSQLSSGTYVLKIYAHNKTGIKQFIKN
ncbi:T9SS type A sorting domain-containing protein [Tamlana sp. 2201CG12-4]|uniref:T9SS type A sorting domain-containing protein n=1 Tax=Tamlana sp. 2201CG12-4 TaxID=3112582 RepID=UPI002DBD5327|nr:T9SS type A sorting domain-containing protein [Tamlana sp. 2201CG12-4]MEC3905531.1 T9SS type A sorting domain-containing protein [Tamlana sp. 2201CG12-4]